MFQLLPKWNHYQQIERDLLRKKQQAYLTLEQLHDMQIDENAYKEGDKTYTGRLLSKYEAECLNRFSSELNRERSVHVREYLKDARHQAFCIAAENISVDQITEAEKARDKRLLAAGFSIT